jgi:hypothetical protein
MDGRKFSVIEAGGKVLSLRLSFNAMVEFNSEVGSVDAAFRNQPFKAFRGLIWSAANAANPGSITILEAGDFCEDYIAEKGYSAMEKTINTLLTDSGWLKPPDEEEPGKNENPAPKRPSKK